MTTAKETEQRIVAIAGGLVHGGRWPQGLANGTCLTTEAHWRAAAARPGNHASLEAQLAELTARASRQHFLDHPVQEAADLTAAAGDQVRDLDPRTAVVQQPIDREDIVLAVEGTWPYLALPDGRTIEGDEESWRAALRGANDHELLVIWAALGRTT